jgi:predicted Rossmann-fold nucleotide-binding protein
MIAGKFQMVRLARALIVAPGGVGTLDELFETLTLLQTKKIKVQRMPIVLLGKAYWKSVINMQAMVDAGSIAGSDVDRLFYTDDVEEAFQYVTERLMLVEADEIAASEEAILSAGTTPIVEANASR